MPGWMIALQVVALVLLIAAVVLAAYASRADRYRIVLISVVVGLAWLVWVLLGGLAGAHPLYLVVAGLLLAVLGVVAGSPLVTLVLRLATRDSRLGAHGGIIVDDSDDDDEPARPREVLRGGMAIGCLERLAIIGCVMAGQLAGLAVIVAIKGLGRYSELENAEARERFIIGTFVSFIWAVVCAAPIALALQYGLS